MRRHPWTAKAFPVIEGLLGFLVVLGIGALILRLVMPGSGDRAAESGQSTALPTEAVATELPTPECNTKMPTARPTATPAPTPEPTATPVTVNGLPEEYFYQEAAPGTAESDPKQNGLTTEKVYTEHGAVDHYVREDEVRMGPSSEYSALEGVTTFRGSNYRDGGAWGTIPESPSGMSIVWKNKISGLDSWSGVGWTGQPSIVRWSDEQKAMMNIRAEKKAVEGLTEVLYATLDGHIYFMDLADGEATRKPIDIGAPIKGSLSVDPRGVPLLYCGQGIYDVKGRRVDCGTRIWSLVDQSLLFFLNGKDDRALRPWRAFDCSPLVDGASDTMLTCGENGVFYTVKLNTELTSSSVSIDPEVVRYVYKQSMEGKLGSENSLAIYSHYAYFATNIGIIQCVDINTMELVWSFFGLDDIDASLVIEVEDDGRVALYAANELDDRGKRGTSQMFKLDALSGELLWHVDSAELYQHNDNGGGSFATPAVGKGELGDLVYFHVCRTVDTGAILYALNKDTGEIVWSYEMGNYGWSSPTCLYTPSGKGYVLAGSSSGLLRLFDGLTGEVVTSIDLDSNIEGTPAVFDDMIVIGTRSAWIYGIRISA